MSTPAVQYPYLIATLFSSLRTSWGFKYSVVFKLSKVPAFIAGYWSVCISVISACPDDDCLFVSLSFDANSQWLEVSGIPVCNLGGSAPVHLIEVISLWQAAEMCVCVSVWERESFSVDCVWGVCMHAGISQTWLSWPHFRDSFPLARYLGPWQDQREIFINHLHNKYWSQPARSKPFDGHPRQKCANTPPSPPADPPECPWNHISDPLSWLIYHMHHLGLLIPTHSLWDCELLLAGRSNVNIWYFSDENNFQHPISEASFHHTASAFCFSCYCQSHLIWLSLHASDGN